MSRNRKRASGGRRRIIKLKWKNRTIVERPCEVEEEGKNTVASEVHKSVMEESCGEVVVIEEEDEEEVASIEGEGDEEMDVDELEHEGGGNSMNKIGEGGSSRTRKRMLGDLVLQEISENRVNLGNVGLTALWNQNPDNLEACR